MHDIWSINFQENHQFVATRCRILRLKFTKFNFGRPRWGNLQRSARPPSWWGGGSLPPPQEPYPRSRPFGSHSSAFRALILGHSGLEIRPFRLQLAAPDIESFRGPWLSTAVHGFWKTWKILFHAVTAAVFMYIMVIWFNSAAFVP